MLDLETWTPGRSGWWCRWKRWWHAVEKNQLCASYLPLFLDSKLTGVTRARLQTQIQKHDLVQIACALSAPCQDPAPPATFQHKAQADDRPGSGSFFLLVLKHLCLLSGLFPGEQRERSAGSWPGLDGKPGKGL